MSDHTRADEREGREPGQDTIREQRDAAMASVARLTAAIEMNAREVASVGLPDEAKWVLAAKDQWQRRATAAEARAVQAGAEVARLTAALKAADYLADRYRAAFLGKPVRDLDEAEAAYQTARTALEAPHADN